MSPSAGSFLALHVLKWLMFMHCFVFLICLGKYLFVCGWDNCLALRSSEVTIIRLIRFSGCLNACLQKWRKAVQSPHITGSNPYVVISLHEIVKLTTNILQNLTFRGTLGSFCGYYSLLESPEGYCVALISPQSTSNLISLLLSHSFLFSSLPFPIHSF